MAALTTRSSTVPMRGDAILPLGFISVSRIVGGEAFRGSEGAPKLALRGASWPQTSRRPSPQALFGRSRGGGGGDNQVCGPGFCADPTHSFCSSGYSMCTSGSCDSCRAIQCCTLPPTPAPTPSPTPATDAGRWHAMAPMSVKRWGVGVCALGGLLYAVGGVGDGQPWTVEAYNPATNAWALMAPMSVARDGPGVGVLGGLLYAVGGSDHNSGLATVEAYAPRYRCDTVTWQCVSDGNLTAVGCEETCAAPPAPTPKPTPTPTPAPTPIPPTPAPTPAPMYSCNAITGDCFVDAKGTQTQTGCAKACKGTTVPTPRPTAPRGPTPAPAPAKSTAVALGLGLGLGVPTVAGGLWYRRQRQQAANNHVNHELVTGSGGAAGFYDAL